MKPNLIYKNAKWLSILTIPLILLVLFVICEGPYILAGLSDRFCDQKFAMDHGIKNSWIDIRNYIENSTRPGINRVEVRSILEKLGEVQYIYESDVMVDSEYTDQIGIKICPDYRYSTIYTVSAHYSPDGKLIYIIFENLADE